MHERVREHLKEMLHASKSAVSFLAVTNETEFLNDEKTQLAVSMCLHIIGEAAARLNQNHTAFVEQYPELPIEDMRGMRNRIAHGYSKINFHVVWETVRDDLPPLIEVLEAIFEGSGGTV